MHRIFRFLISVIVVLSLCGACLAESQESQPTPEPTVAPVTMTVTDQAGREVLIKTPATRIVSCYYISTAALIALGLEDNLVGVEMKAETRGLYNLAAPQIINLPAVGSGKGVNIEEIAALEPDVVILPLRLADDAAALENLGIPVILVNPETQTDFEACLRLLGVITGKYEEASALLDRCGEITSLVTEAVADAEKPTVYLAAGSDYLTTYPSGLYQDDLISVSGGVNAAAGMDGDSKITVDAEQLLEWDPDYIFIVADADYTADDLMNDAQLASLTAVTEGRVYSFPSGVEPWDYPTPSSALGQLYMASIIHPDVVTPDDFMEGAAAFYNDIFGIEITSGDLGL
jgi:iron complex transport system substrate-binding protein